MKKITLFLALSIFINAQVDYETQIQPIWDNNCASCHTGGNLSGQLDLGAGSWNNLVNISSANYAPALRVVPYDPNNSVLYHKLFYTNQYGNGMPPNSAGGQLPLSERQLVERWINEGATEGGGGVGPTYIDITSPNSSSNWSAGTGEDIEWNSNTSDGMDYLVNIALLKSGSDYQIIESGFISGSNGGMFWWSIPEYLEDGNDYQIRVYHVDSGEGDYSDNFQITGGGGGTGGMIEGTVGSSESTYGTVFVGLFDNPDPQNWFDRLAERNLGSQSFPNYGIWFDFQEEWIIDGDYSVVAFIDENSDQIPDEGEAIGMASVTVTSGYGNTGEITMPYGGGGFVSGNLHSDESVSGELFVGLFSPNNGGEEWDPDWWQSWYVTFPSDQYYLFDESGISNGYGYEVRAFVDANNNYFPDPEELQGKSGDFEVLDGLASNIDFDLNYEDETGGYSLQLDGNTFVETGFSAYDGGPEFTFELFFKVFYVPGTGEIFGLFRRDDWGFLEYDGSQQKFIFGLDGIGQVEYTISLVTDEWHHIAAEYDGSNLRIYLDGMVAAMASGGGSLNDVSADVLHVGENLDGLIDIVRMSDTGIYGGSSFDPYNNDYSAGGGVHLLWHCDEGSGNELYDASGTDHTGNIYGTPMWNADEPIGGFMYPQLWPTDSGPDFVALEWDRWQDSDAEFDKYELRWNTNGGVNEGDQSILTETNPNVRNMTHNGAAQGDNYYKLWMYDQGGFSRYETNEVYVNVGGGGGGPTYIDVISPNSSSNWSAGTGEDIDWSSSTSDGMGYDVDIELYKGGYYYEEIEGGYQSSSFGGNFWWSIPEYLEDGNDYHIRVYHVDSGVENYSDYFQISGGGGGGPTYIQVTSPDSMSNWTTGMGESIDWSSSTSDGMVYIVDIELWKGGLHYETIDAVWQSSSFGDNYWWFIPDNLPDGNDYEVRVVHNDSGVEDFSDNFQITGGGGGTDNGKIAGEILVERTIGGTIYVDLYYPGSVMNEDLPDTSIPFDLVNLAPGIGWYYEFPDLPDGNGYTVQCLIDADGSPNTGTGNCDAGEDLQGTIQNIVILDGSQENGDIDLEECSGDDYPTISNFAVTSGDAYVNSSDVEIYVQLDASSGIAEAKFSYYKGGDNTAITEQDLTLETAGTVDWVGTISAEDVTMEGLMVKISAKSNDGYEQPSNWFEIPVHFNEYGFAALPHKQYTMVSFPGDLDNDNVKSVIENSLGAYDPALWRSFSYNSSTAGGYDENSGDFKAGRAVWVITSETSTALDGGNGEVTSLETPFPLSLKQGWNMIGNPYAFNVDLTNHISASGDVEMTLHKWNGNAYVSKNDMAPGDGYWIWSNEDGASLEFDHKPSGGSQKQMTGGWEFNLSAAINGYYDSENKLGAHPLADDERDGMDAHEPPVIGDYVQLAFDNTDWTDKGIYSKDIRKEGQSSYTWDVDVKSNIAGQISINGLNTSYIPLEYDAVLIDLENRVQHNLRSGEVYNYVSIGAEQPHNFQVIVGLPENVSKSIESLGILPTEFSVDQNVPNPFNPITSIRVQLVEDARVTMKIFNILGEEVLTLIDNEFMKSGHRQVIWNGRDNFNRQLPSGLYLYQTVILNNQGKLLHMNTNKMIMVK